MAVDAATTELDADDITGAAADRVDTPPPAASTYAAVNAWLLADSNPS
jgi:hypothetical protein